MLYDSIIVSGTGYRADTVPCITLKVNTVVQLVYNSTLLKAVTVKSRKSNADSTALRSDFKNIFEYKKPHVIEAFSLTSVNVDILYASLSRKNKNKLRQILLYNERENYIDSRFNRRLLLRFTKLGDEDIKFFLTMYRPDYKYLIKLSDYDLLIYTRDCLKKYEVTLNKPSLRN